MKKIFIFSYIYLLYFGGLLFAQGELSPLTESNFERDLKNAIRREKVGDITSAFHIYLKIYRSADKNSQVDVSKIHYYSPEDYDLYYGVKSFCQNKINQLRKNKVVSDLLTNYYEKVDEQFKIYLKEENIELLLKILEDEFCEEDLFFKRLEAVIYLLVKRGLTQKAISCLEDAFTKFPINYKNDNLSSIKEKMVWTLYSLYEKNPNKIHPHKAGLYYVLFNFNLNILFDLKQSASNFFHLFNASNRLTFLKKFKGLIKMTFPKKSKVVDIFGNENGIYNTVNTKFKDANPKDWSIVYPEIQETVSEYSKLEEIYYRYSGYRFSSVNEGGGLNAIIVEDKVIICNDAEVLCYSLKEKKGLWRQRITPKYQKFQYADYSRNIGRYSITVLMNTQNFLTYGDNKVFLTKKKLEKRKIKMSGYSEYYYELSNHLYCLNLKNGKIIWRTDESNPRLKNVYTKEEKEEFLTFFSPPLFSYNNIYITGITKKENEHKYVLYCLDSITGKPKWCATIGFLMLSDQNFFPNQKLLLFNNRPSTDGYGRIFFSHTPYFIGCANAYNGSILWLARYSLKSSKIDRRTSQPYDLLKPLSSVAVCNNAVSIMSSYNTIDLMGGSAYDIYEGVLFFDTITGRLLLKNENTKWLNKRIFRIPTESNIFYCAQEDLTIKNIEEINGGEVIKFKQDKLSGRIFKTSEGCVYAPLSNGVYEIDVVDKKMRKIIDCKFSDILRGYPYKRKSFPLVLPFENGFVILLDGFVKIYYNEK